MVDLTPKQEAFAQAYVEGGNAAAAYRQCYDVSPSAKSETVWSEASLLLGNPNVTARFLRSATKCGSSTPQKITHAALIRAGAEIAVTRTFPRPPLLYGAGTASFDRSRRTT
jgi:Terminase small subunit